MKLKITLATLVLLLAGPALGQATYTFNATAPEVTALTTERPIFNAAVCAKVGVPSGCTQAAARNAFCVSVGLASSCTYAAARDAWCVRNTSMPKAPCTGLPTIVIAATAEELFQAKSSAELNKLRAEQKAAQGQSFCGPGGIWRSLNQTQKDALCTSPGVGLGAGCDLCP
jgi:hypothetical protein